MAVDMEKVLNRFAQAKPNGGGGLYFDRGYGRAAIKHIESKDTQEGYQCFTAACEIETNTPSFEGEQVYLPGTEVTYFDWWESPNVKDKGCADRILTFLMTVTGNPQSDFSPTDLVLDSDGRPIPVLTKAGTPALRPDGQPVFLTKHRRTLLEIEGRDQPLCGVVFDFTTRKKKTKAGQIITVPTFKHVEQTEAQIAAKRAAILAKTKAAA